MRRMCSGCDGLPGLTIAGATWVGAMTCVLTIGFGVGRGVGVARCSMRVSFAIVIVSAGTCGIERLCQGKTPAIISCTAMAAANAKTKRLRLSSKYLVDAKLTSLRRYSVRLLVPARELIVRGVVPVLFVVPIAVCRLASAHAQ